MKILFFIESLRSGGKERRFLELLKYLKKNSELELFLVLTRNEIHYEEFKQLSIPFKVITRKFKKDPLLFFKFWLICKSVKPSCIHSWGTMVSFYSIPAAVTLGIPLINNEITRAPQNFKGYGFLYFISKANFLFSSKILSNSYEGLKSYNTNSTKSKVIYNGIDLKRFEKLDSASQTKKTYNIKTDLVVCMVASFSKKKNYRLYFDVAEDVLKKRNDVTFLAVGGRDKGDQSFEMYREKYKGHPNISVTGTIDSGLESLLNVCTCGVLLTDREHHGEGISNAILEFFALKKPVIANNTGGTKELIVHNHNGILVDEDDKDLIVDKLTAILTDTAFANKLGYNAFETVREKFSIQKMGNDYINLYQSYQSDS